MSLVLWMTLGVCVIVVVYLLMDDRLENVLKRINNLVSKGNIVVLGLQVKAKSRQEEKERKKRQKQKEEQEKMLNEQFKDNGIETYGEEK